MRRSIDRPFSSVFLSSSRSFALSSRCRWCSFRPRRDKTRKTRVLFDARFHFDFERDRVSEICFSLLTHISPLSLSLEQHSMLHRRRVRRGPDHGHDRAEVPAHRGKQRARLSSSFRAFHHDIIVHLYSSPKCGGPKRLRVRHTTGPRRRHFFDARATQSPKRKERDERLVALVMVFCRRFSSGVGCSLSLSLSRECNTNLSLSSLKLCTNLFFLLRAKRSPWSI